MSFVFRPTIEANPDPLPVTTTTVRFINAPRVHIDVLRSRGEASVFLVGVF